MEYDGIDASDRNVSSGMVEFDISSSACSGMFGSIFRPLHELGNDSSNVDRNGLRRLPALIGEDGRRGAKCPGCIGVMNRPDESRPGDEYALCIGGIVAEGPGVYDRVSGVVGGSRGG